jgi:ATP/ADP translocase
MSEAPKEKLTVADLVEAQRKTASQLEAINEKLQNIGYLTQGLATTDQRARSVQGFDIMMLVLLIAGLLLLCGSHLKDQAMKQATTEDFISSIAFYIAFELAIVIFLLVRSLNRASAVTRLHEVEKANETAAFRRNKIALKET